MEDTVTLALRIACVPRDNARVSSVVVNAREMIHTIVDMVSNDVTLIHVRLTDQNTTLLTNMGIKNLPEG